MGWNECHIYPSREERHDSQAAKPRASSLLMSRINTSPFIIFCLLVLKGPLKARIEKRWKKSETIHFNFTYSNFLLGIMMQSHDNGLTTVSKLENAQNDIVNVKFHCYSSQLIPQLLCAGQPAAKRPDDGSQASDS